jgi:hypothetical protein
MSALPNQLIVSGAGAPEFNGIYTIGAIYADSIATWYKTPDIRLSLFLNPDGDQFSHDYIIADFSSTYGNINIYRSIGTVPTEDFSADVLTWELLDNPELAPAPTVAIYIPAPSTVTFPSSPTLNQSFTAGSRTWVFNGTAWKLQPKTTDAITEGSTNKYYTDARVAAAPAVTALESRAGTIESAATSLEGRVSTAEGSITTLTSGLATEKGRVDAILLAADADKDSFAEIVQLINSVDAENDTAFAGYVTSNNAAVSAIEGRVTTAEGDIDALESRATSIESAATSLTTRVSTAEGTLSTHVAATDNPHSVTKTQVGLSNVDNTSDANKPVSTAQQAAIDTKQDKNVLSATAPSHVEGLVWIDTTDMSQYVSFGGAWVELDKA